MLIRPQKEMADINAQIREQLELSVINKVNAERVNNGKQVLKEEQISAIKREVASVNTLKIKCFESTTVYSNEYVTRTVNDNMDKNENIIDIIKKYIGLV